VTLLDLQKLYEFDASGGSLRVMDAKPWSMADLWQRFSREAGQEDGQSQPGSEEGRGGTDSGDAESAEEPSREAQPDDRSGNPLVGPTAASGSGLPPESIRQVQPAARTSAAPPISFRESAGLVPLSSLFEGTWGMSFTTEPLLPRADVAELALVLLDEPDDQLAQLMFRHGVQRDVGEPKVLEVWEAVSARGERFFVVAWEMDGDLHGDREDSEVAPEEIWQQMEAS